MAGEASCQLAQMTNQSLLDPFAAGLQHGPAGCWVCYEGQQHCNGQLVAPVHLAACHSVLLR